MQRPWMPLYIADYLADTVHLTTCEHGAYLLLIMAYWKDGKLPQEDGKLARICRLPPAEWADMRDTIAELFQEGWKHARIDEELSKVASISEKRKAARAQVGKRPTSVATNVTTDDQTNGVTTEGLVSTHSHSHSHSHPDSQKIETADAVSGDGSLDRPEQRMQPDRPGSKAKHPPEAYFVDEPGFRVTHADVEKWQKTFPNINVAGEVLAGPGWVPAKIGRNWYSGFMAYLTKKDQAAKADADSRRVKASAEADAAARPKPNSRYHIQ